MNKAVEQTLVLADDTRIAVLPDWRQLSYAERGKFGGKPILVFHDAPGSRMQQYPDRSLAPAMDVVLIHPDRPGCGMSTPLAKRSFRDWADDAGRLADLLHIDRFAIVAIGGGGPFALACAAFMPERVTKVALAASYVPPEMLARGNWRLRLKLRLARAWPGMLRGALKKDSYLARKDVDQYLNHLARRLGPRDAQSLSNPLLRAQYEQDAREAFRQSTRGLRADLRLLAEPWDIPMNRIRAELRFWHGAQDRIVPAEAARRLALGLQAEFIEVADGGHLLWYAQWPAMLEFARG